MKGPTHNLIWICASLFMATSVWALDIVTLATGEMKTGNIRSYADGVFVLDTYSGGEYLNTNELQRITFSSETEGIVTSTNGATGTLRILSYGDGTFVFQKDAMTKSSFSCQRVRKIEFQQSRVAPPVSSGTSGTSFRTGNNASVGRGSYSSSGTHSGRVWVAGYYRNDGTWVERHWRDTTGAGTYISTARSSGNRVWVPGYRRSDGTWVDGYWRDAGSPGASSSSSHSYSGGGSVYVGGYFRKDGTYVRGYRRRK